MTDDEVIGMYADRLGLTEQEARALLPSADKLRSSLQRPENRAHYEDADFVRPAATLAHALSEGHNFTDGNKRIAYD